MTKTELWTQVQEVLKAHKASNKLSIELEQLLAPKAGGSVVANPMKTQDGINYHFCRYSQLYIKESEMVMSNGKSKGYSKLAIAKWTKAGKVIQELNNKAMAELLAGNTDTGKALAGEAEDLKSLRNEPSYYTSDKELMAKLMAHAMA